MGKVDFKPGRKCGACWRELTGALGAATQGGLDQETEQGTWPAELSPRPLSRDKAALVLSIADNPSEPSAFPQAPHHWGSGKLPRSPGSQAELLPLEAPGWSPKPRQQKTPTPAGSVFTGAVKLGRAPGAVLSNDHRRS